MKISPARSTTFDILLRIEKQRSFSSELLPRYTEKLSAADRGLCYEITLGVLRRKLFLDRVIANLTNGKKIDIEARVSLWIGLFQLHFLDRIPHYSIVNESVELVVKARKTSARSFVNALLRRAIREPADLQFATESEKLSVETSHPLWLVEKWIADLGLTRTQSICTANNLIPRAAFRYTCRTNAETVKTIESNHELGIKPSEIINNAFIAEKISDELRNYAEGGNIYFQDEASQVVANLIELNNGGSFLDVCASPGGKTGLAAKNASSVKDLIIAGDLHESRVLKLSENLKNQGCENVNIVRYDALAGLPFGDQSFDTVLVDAPCSGTGTISRNPELRYLLQETDIKDLASKQFKILEEASRLVKIGGRLIYSTCSLEREENEDVVSAFLNDHAHFKSLRPQINERLLTKDGFIRTYPDRDGTDGFFMAIFTH